MQSQYSIFKTWSFIHNNYVLKIEYLSCNYSSNFLVFDAMTDNKKESEISITLPSGKKYGLYGTTVSVAFGTSSFAVSTAMVKYG